MIDSHKEMLTITTTLNAYSMLNPTEWGNCSGKWKYFAPLKELSPESRNSLKKEHRHRAFFISDLPTTVADDKKILNGAGHESPFDERNNLNFPSLKKSENKVVQSKEAIFKWGKPFLFLSIQLSSNSLIWSLPFRGYTHRKHFALLFSFYLSITFCL